MRYLLLLALVFTFTRSSAQATMAYGFNYGRVHTSLRGPETYSYSTTNSGIMMLSGGYLLRKPSRPLYFSVTGAISLFQLQISETHTLFNPDRTKNIFSLAVIPGINYALWSNKLQLGCGIGLAKDINTKGQWLTFYERGLWNIPLTISCDAKIAGPVSLGVMLYKPLRSYTSIAPNYNKEYGNDYGATAFLISLKLYDRVAE